MKTLLAILTGILAVYALLPAAQALEQPVPSVISVPPPPPPMQRSITVSGEAREEVAPDQAVLSMSIVSKDKELNVAKQHNDTMADRVLNIARQFEIPQEKIATSGINISPEYNYTNSEQHFVGYTVNRSLRITLDKIDTQERVLSALVDAKVDQVNGVEFQLADPEAHAAKLRVKAFDDAKAKAQALAQAAGSKLGPALYISTVDMTPPLFPPRPMPMMAVARAAGPAESVAPSLPGMIGLNASVTVTFALE